MILKVDSSGWLETDGRRFRCALGKGGIKADKREGDGATPTGSFKLRKLLYRPDRMHAPHCVLPIAEIAEDDGWCDDPGHPDYNLPVKLPHPASCERLWREDAVYDLVVPVGYNDDPPVAGLGSAIFLHLARPDYQPTEGCVALALPDLLTLLTMISADTRIEVAAPGNSA